MPFSYNRLALAVRPVTYSTYEHMQQVCKVLITNFLQLRKNLRKPQWVKVLADTVQCCLSLKHIEHRDAAADDEAADADVVVQHDRQSS